MRLLLHVGTHRTGTTSIQQVLASNRDWLRERGIVYPDASRWFGGSDRAHIRFAHALTGTDPQQLGVARRFVAALAERTRPDQTVLLSAEPLYRGLLGTRDWTAPDLASRRRGYLQRLAELLVPFEVRVLVLLRPHHEVAGSLYVEAVCSGSCDTDFEHFLHRRHRFFDYSTAIAGFEAYVGEVEVRRYAPEVLPVFFSALGTEVPPTRGPVVRRRSADPRLALWMLRRDPAERHLQRRFAGSRLARRMFADEVGLWRSVEQRDAFVARFGGAYGAAFFPPPPPRVAPTASLTERDRAALDRRYRLWRVLDPIVMRVR